MKTRTFKMQIKRFRVRLRRISDRLVGKGTIVMVVDHSKDQGFSPEVSKLIMRYYKKGHEVIVL